MFLHDAGVAESRVPRRASPRLPRTPDSLASGCNRPMRTTAMRRTSRPTPPRAAGRRATGWVAALVALLTSAGAGAGAGAVAAEPRLELRRGDHVAVIGNTLADRMQHDGWLEARLHARFPDHDLTYRDLGFSGDEIGLRLRSANFG